MSIVSNGPGGYSNVYAMQPQASSAPLYTTLTGAPGPVAQQQQQAAPSVSMSYGQQPASLMQSPSNYAPSPYGIKESDDYTLQLSSPQAKKKQSSNPVILATIPVYALFLASVASAVTLTGLGKFRGRHPQFTWNSEPGSENAKLRALRKWNVYKGEIDDHTYSAPGMGRLAHHKIGEHAGPSAAEDAEKARAYRDLGFKNHTEMMTNFVSTKKNVYEHNAWWHAHDIMGKDGEYHQSFIGFHGKGSSLAGHEFKDERGVLTLAVPKAAREQLEKDLSGIIPDLKKFEKTPSEKTRAGFAEKPLFGVSDRHGLEALEHFEIPLGAEDGDKRIREVAEKLGIKPDEMLQALKSNGRLGANERQLNKAHTWTEQFELGEGNQSILRPTEWGRKWGMAQFRAKSWGKGYRNSWYDSFEAGGRAGFMNQSSVPLTACLVLLTTLAAYGVALEQKHKNNQQNQATH